MQFFKTPTDETLKENVRHGTKEYPFAYYIDDINKFDIGYIDWHWHPEVEFVTVLEGSIDCFIGEKKIHLEVGTGLFINSGVIHKFETNNIGIMPNIVFLPTLISSKKTYIYETFISPIILNGPSYLIIEPNNALLNKLNDIFKIQETVTNSRKTLKTLNLVTELWDSLLDNISICTKPNQNNQHTYKTSRLHVMLQFVHDNYFKTITLEEIAESSNISKSNATQLFQNGVCQSPISYLITYRLKKAAELLKETNATISYIASTTGFSTDTYFCRKFKERYKMRPTEYRKKSNL